MRTLVSAWHGPDTAWSLTVLSEPVLFCWGHLQRDSALRSCRSPSQNRRQKQPCDRVPLCRVPRSHTLGPRRP